MITGPADHLAAVDRALTTVERDGQQLTRLVATRRYPAVVEDVWDALTNAERIPRWFLPISGDLRVGGRYQFEGNAGGEIRACRPPRALEATWEMGEQISFLAVTLDPDGQDTVLTLTHDAPVDPGMWEQFGPGAVGIGWELGLRGLAEHLATGEALDAAAAEAWTLSPDGVAAVSVISRAWAEANVAFGADPAQAEAGSQACIAFYTTIPDSALPDSTLPDSTPPAAEG